jgi:endonuclease/exonuclease/phosphatase family metal-dependent hydrolase
MTETDSSVTPYYQHCFQTKNTINEDKLGYKDTETRVSIFTNYRCIRQYSTFNPFTAVCVELDTPEGSILVYGTIMGVYGNRHSSYMTDLQRQINDFSNLLTLGKPLCICGDFNCSFADNYYFTKTGRESLLEFFTENHITVLTENRGECIDHIAVSDSFIKDTEILIDEWNYNKILSDHKGISAQINFWSQCPEVVVIEGEHK